jgi:hypothetical protein
LGIKEHILNASSKIQILVVGPVQDKKWEGREYQIQEAECVMLNDDGSPQGVAVLRLADEMRGPNAPKPGLFTAAFTLRANPKDRRLEARLAGLTPFNAPKH